MKEEKEFAVGSTWSDGYGILVITAAPDEKGVVQYTRDGKFIANSHFAKKLKPFKKKEGKKQ